MPSDLSMAEIKLMENLMSILHGCSPAIKSEHLFLGAQTNDRSDVRLFDAYYQSIEKENEFRQNQLKILLTVSLDGFVPKGLTRREIWPLYLRVENISQPDADKFTNSILCGVLYTQSKPTQKMLETLFGRLESELRSLHEDPLQIEVNDVLWPVHVSLYRGMADMGAQRALFRLPRWESPHGCSKCLIGGERIGNRRVWVCGDEEISLRHPECFIREQGFTPVMRLITPEKSVSDALHIASEDLTEDRLQVGNVSNPFIFNFSRCKFHRTHFFSFAGSRSLFSSYFFVFQSFTMKAHVGYLL
ncbi:unnamed protein product [Cylicostephanus goldi]|uniref:Uncharacterized protein n=1 Tax=Cylicostephanus goldi TaxID=71465 RepID=A0A3P6QZ48_CYLGO|nr:unnamed protein product [Cylicostephanus goldi]